MTDDKQQGRISRRSFMGAAGLGVVAGAVVGIAGTAGLARTQTGGGSGLPKSWDKTADVVVVGSGMAAFAAAVTAQGKGSSVIMLEKASIYGGTTAKAGNWWIPNNSYMQKAGLTDPKPDAMKYMARLSYPTLYDASAPKLGLPDLEYSLLDTYYDTGSVAVDALGVLGAPSSPNGWVIGTPGGFNPDYHSDFPEDKAPYGRDLSATDGGSGAGMIKQFKKVADAKGIPVLTEHRVTRILRNSSGQVVGVEATHGGATVTVRANKAVVFGSGGFTHNPEMRRNYLRGPIFGGCAVPTNTGDFVTMGIDVGAALGNMNNAFWAENAFEQAMQNTSVPNDIWMPYGDSMVHVNRYGRRVVNEKMIYNERTQAHFAWDGDKGEYPNLVLMMVYDDAVAKDARAWPFRDPIPMPGVDSPLVISGATWGELSSNIDARLAKYSATTGGYKLDSSFAANLVSTINRFNSFAAAGTDQDFARGQTPIAIAWNGPARAGNTKNPTMYPFSSSGPYHAILVGGGTLDTKGGPKINTKSQVIDAAGKPIPGLYGAGNCIASPAGQAYWSAGGTLGPALTYGYIAGLNASQEPVKAV
jgi:succinate dehydrogenase/fumarate reductase flavoprotein subunit